MLRSITRWVSWRQEVRCCQKIDQVNAKKRRLYVFTDSLKGTKTFTCMWRKSHEKLYYFNMCFCQKIVSCGILCQNWGRVAIKFSLKASRIFWTRNGYKIWVGKLEAEFQGPSEIFFFHVAKILLAKVHFLYTKVYFVYVFMRLFCKAPNIQRLMSTSKNQLPRSFNWDPSGSPTPKRSNLKLFIYPSTLGGTGYRGYKL